MSKKTEWEKEFEEKFEEAGCGLCVKETEEAKEVIKAFISKQLAKEKMELIKKIEGLRKVIPEEELQDYTRGWYVGANEVLDDLLSEMQEEVGG